MWQQAGASTLLLRLIFVGEAALAQLLNVSDVSNSTSNISNSSNISNVSSTAPPVTTTGSSSVDANLSQATTYTTTWASASGWPPCPLQGCLPCPPHASGRPNCTCMEGYTTTGLPLNSSVQEPLTWDRVDGWVERCFPVACGNPPALDYGKRVDAFHVTADLSFPERAEYLCELGYIVSGNEEVVEAFASTSAPPSNGSETLDTRLIYLDCDVNGTFTHDPQLDLLCVPVCGDGLLMPIDHLPVYDPREQCDDGNRLSGDGCSHRCRVESEWVCHGGSTTSADVCKKSEIQADSVLVLEVSGPRTVNETELSKASRVAIGEGLIVPGKARDVEISKVLMSDKGVPISLASTSAAETSSVTTSTPSLADVGNDTSRGQFHTYAYTVEVAFIVKISAPQTYDIDKLAGELRFPKGLMARLWVAYSEKTSLNDMYVRVVYVAEPELTGDISKGRIKKWVLSAWLMEWAINLSPLYGYFFITFFVAPSLVYLVRVRPRRYKLMGRYPDVLPEFKGNWAFNICAGLEHRLLCCSLIFCVPARLAETWDSLGVLPYWQGLRRGILCCCLYLVPGCQCVGAAVAGRMRSNIRDFFGFGDEVEGNLEFADCLCYCLCPLCCIVQEAKHVDLALRMLPPPPEESPDWMYDMGHAEVGHATNEHSDA